MFNPEGGLPRLFRYVPVMPTPDILTLYFPKQNLLMINKEHWEGLSDEMRHRVMRTEERCLEINYPANRPPVVTPRVMEDA